MKQTINIGAAANDGTGDLLRDAFDKANDNFNELYGYQDIGMVTDNTLTEVILNAAFGLTPATAGIGWCRLIKNTSQPPISNVDYRMIRSNGINWLQTSYNIVL